MKLSTMPNFKHVVIVSDGIRGHYHQSLGIASWVSRLSGATMEKFISVPKLSSFERYLTKKLNINKLGDKDYINKWLNNAGFRTEQRFEPETLFISAGSSAAPFCLALARATGNKAAVVMTPSILGTKPFDFAIVPEHDKFDPNDKNIITTLGAPNHIYEPEIKEIGQKFFMGKDFSGKKVFSILIGGSDANYNVTPQWARKALEPFKHLKNTVLLITTSRRTGPEVEDAVWEMFSDCKYLEYVLLMSKNPRVNALSAILGVATHVFATEDSVSMVSETATAGFKVGLIRVPRVPTSYIKNLVGAGAKRFDEMFNKMIFRGLVTDIKNESTFDEFIATAQQKHNKDFNEAKRVAEWILKA